MGFNKVVTAKSTQTVFDLALQLYGSVDKVFEMLAANPDIENLESDVTGIVVNYEINNTYVQREYINKSVSVSSKPKRYLNANTGALLIGPRAYLKINNGYKLLI